ncbi:glycosyltransferase [Flavobacterium sp. DGU38]|uniref:Glycosyltransferase n=1 Tax=Flavobacterium calami TaxID=3139144 RepID=A0ABU9IS75_9FLAO
MKKFLCIIPFYNEEIRFYQLPYEDLFSKYPEIDFLLIDDGSSDNTLNILKNLRDKNHNVKLILIKKNLGKAEAIRTGVLNDISIDYEYVGYLDADLATPMIEMKRLFTFISNRESIVMVMGSRIKLLGNGVDRSYLRHYLGRIFATIISGFILKVPVYDTQCGAKIIRTDFARRIFKEPFLTKWIFDVELLLRFRGNGMIIQDCVVEIPLEQWKERGNSKIKLKEFVLFPFQILKIHFYYAK